MKYLWLQDDKTEYSRDSVWVTSEYKEIRVRDMPEEHIAKTINWIEDPKRKLRWDKTGWSKGQFIKLLKEELDIRKIEYYFDK